MSEFPESTTTVSPEIANLYFANLHKQKGFSNAAGTNTRQNLINTSSSSVEESSSTSQQVLNSSSTSSTSSSTTSRVAKTSSSQRLHHVSTSSSTSEMKAHALKRDLNDIKNSMSEINNLASMGRVTSPTIGELKLTNSTTMSELQKRIRSSLENLVDGNENEPLVTFPDGDSPSEELQRDLSVTMPVIPTDLRTTVNGGQLNTDTLKFEEKRTTSASSTKVVTDGFSAEKATSNSAEMKRLQTGDIEYEQAKSAAAVKNTIEVNNVMAEQSAAMISLLLLQSKPTPFCQ